MYADIIVDISHEQLDKTFQYRVPENLAQQIEAGVMVNVPFGKGNRLITGYVISLGDEPKFYADKIKDIDSVVPDKTRAVGRMIKLAAWLRNNYGSTMNQALKTVIPVKEKVRPKEKRTVKLIISDDEAQEKLFVFERKNATARYRLLEALIQEKQIDFEIVKTKLNITSSTVKALENMGIIEVITQNLYRNPIKYADDKEQKIELNGEQKIIVDSFRNDYDSGVRNTYLLYGVTGSGKTLCYMEMIEHVICKGRQVIMLIPEIALTFQTVQRFYKRFGNKVSIMNSRMYKGERYDQFLRAMKGEISIMIGPRSALFTPFPDIGLIVIDEEHEWTYKSEQSPRYHARETAIHIAKECNASVVLGSATPSLEAFYRASQGEYKLFKLSDRAAGARMPTVSLIDLRQELKEGNRSIFSRKLQQLMSERLQKNQQIMLFLNKRGYAGFVSCRSCGHVMKCPHCDISLTAHNNGRLVCHYCGYEEPQVKVCPECGSKYISGFRAGTQQVEELINKMFPQARTLRMDMDTTSGKDGHEKILAAFANHEADILIGTQMIVKGHDFASVTLVGVLAADMSLYASDYRASERTFQLLVQASGRAGRGEDAGEVVIQTYSPDNYSIKTSKNQDYEEFYEEEIAFRQIMHYPPVYNLLRIAFSSKNKEKLEKACEIIADKQKEYLLENMTSTGPVEAGVYKIKDIYTRILYVKSQNYDDLINYKDKIECYTKDNKEFNMVTTQFDFN